MLLSDAAALLLLFSMSWLLLLSITSLFLALKGEKGEPGGSISAVAPTVIQGPPGPPVSIKQPPGWLQLYYTSSISYNIANHLQ